MPEIIGSDPINFKTKVSLEAEGVAGYTIKTAGLKTFVISTGDLTTRIINPNSRRIIFCSQKQGKLVTQTFNIDLISIATVTRESKIADIAKKIEKGEF